MNDDKVHKLHTVAPLTAKEELRAEVIALLRDALEQAEAGDVDEVLILMRHPGDDEWSNLASETLGFAAWIGRIEITKLDWIEQYREHHRDG